jgi:glycosyltransferase involved in cell wall biosynthesis
MADTPLNVAISGKLNGIVAREVHVGTYIYGGSDAPTHTHEGATEAEMFPALRKACFISSEYPPSIVGGLGIHVQKLTTALAQHMDVDVVLPRPMKEATRAYEYAQLSNNVRSVVLPVDTSYREGNQASWCTFARNAANTITSRPKSELPDVLHCHDWVTALAGIKCRWALNIPLVFHVHLPNSAPLCASIENLGLVSADLVTVSSENIKGETMNRRMPIDVGGGMMPIRDIKVVKNGVDLGVFQPSKDWPADEGYILMVGRLVEQKGVEHLLRAFSYVREKFSVKLKIVGQGECKEWLERLSYNLLIGGDVEFLPHVQHEELAKLYQQARLIAVPSVFEPFGMVALEAMACKRAVVASRVGGLTEIIKDGTTGYLAHPKDHLDLAQWIMTLLANDDLRNRMGDAGYDRVSAEGYTWPSVADHVKNLYLTVRKNFKIGEKPKGAEPFIRQIKEQVAQKDKENWDDLLDNLFDRSPR